MILTARVERLLSKSEILELYLNSTYLGRGSWGVEMAARSYFGKSVKALSLGEGALLAALTKGPTYFSPDQHPDRAQERVAYVLGRMQEDGAVSAAEVKQASNPTAGLVAYMNSRRDSGFHFVDNLAREAKAVAGIDALTADSYTVHSTILPQLQRATEAALQEGLARFEIDGGRVSFQHAEANLANAIKRIQPDASPNSNPNAKVAQGKPAWLQALTQARLPLYDVHWPVAVVVDKGKSGDAIRVGLTDGRVVPLSGLSGSIQRSLKLYDVVFVHLSDSKSKSATRAEIRVRPVVQGAALVLDNKTGRILAMSGGFSYPLSQLNRTTQSQRQPGSALKPLTYLAALQKGLQPNTIVRDQEITLPPIGGGVAREQDYWTPKNYDRSEWGVVTLRRALENSRNLATVNLLDGGIEGDPHGSLDRVCGLALEAQIYRECVPYYPFVLGAQPVRPIDLAPFYAAIANEGVRPQPYAIESIEHNGLMVYRHEASSARIASADRVSFFQLKTMLQGVLARGTAHAISALSPYVAGKTGTTESENDAWFVGFTNDVTVAVWVGYDNADGKRRTLGGGSTGASVAIPIFEPIIQAVWAQYAPKSLLNPPSAEAKRDLVARPINLASGDVVGNGNGNGNTKSFVEYFRRDRGGNPYDTQFQLVSRDEAYTAQPREADGTQEFVPFDSGGRYPPAFGDPRGSGYPPQQVLPQRRDAYGQPFGQPYGQTYAQPPRGGDPRSGPQPRGNSGFFWDWH
jgi:penicillin-binding protein 1A